VVTAAASRGFKTRINTGQDHGMTFECSADLANSMFLDGRGASEVKKATDLDFGDFVVDGTKATLPGKKDADDALNNALLKYPAGDVDPAWETVLGSRRTMRGPTPLGHPRGTQNLAKPVNSAGNNGTATCSLFCDKKGEACTAAAFRADGEPTFTSRRCDYLPDGHGGTTDGIVQCFCVPKQNDNNHAVFMNTLNEGHTQAEVVVGPFGAKTDCLSVIHVSDKLNSYKVGDDDVYKVNHTAQYKHEVYMEGPVLTKALLLEAQARGIKKIGWEYIPYATDWEDQKIFGLAWIELRIGLIPTGNSSTNRSDTFPPGLLSGYPKWGVDEPDDETEGKYRPRFLVKHRMQHAEPPILRVDAWRSTPDAEHTQKEHTHEGEDVRMTFHGATMTQTQHDDGAVRSLTGWEDNTAFRVMIETNAPHAVHVGKGGGISSTIELDNDLTNFDGEEWHKHGWRWSFDSPSRFGDSRTPCQVSASGFADLAFVTELE
jgi:hypothetical protein